MASELPAETLLLGFPFYRAEILSLRLEGISANGDFKVLESRWIEDDELAKALNEAFRESAEQLL